MEGKASIETLKPLCETKGLDPRSAKVSVGGSDDIIVCEDAEDLKSNEPEKCVQNTTELEGKEEELLPLYTAENVAKVLSLDKHFTSKWALPLNRFEGGRYLNERLRDFFVDRARLEEDYATKLSALAHKFSHASLESTQTIASVNSFRAEVLRRAEQGKEFSLAIRKDILDGTLNPAILNDTNLFKQVKYDANELMKTFEKIRVDHTRALQKYEAAGREADQSVTTFQNSERQIPVYRSTLALASLKKCQEMKIAEEEYFMTIKRSNDTINLLCKRMEQILAFVRDMDEKRILSFKEALQKFFVHETSCLRNAEYDIGNSIKVVEELNAASEVQEFLMANELTKKLITLKLMPVLWYEANEMECMNEDVSSPVNSSQPSLPIVANAARNFFQRATFNKAVNTANSFFTSSSKQNSSSSSESSMPAPPPDGVVDSFEAIFSVVLDCLWNNKLEDLEASLAPYPQALQSSLQRFVICKCLLKRCLERKFKLPSVEALQSLCTVCELILDFSDKQGDVWSGRTVMLIAQQFYADINDQQEKAGKEELPKSSNTKEQPLRQSANRLTLQRAIYHHQLWNRVTFWEEALTITISEALQLDMLRNKWKALSPEAYAFEMKDYMKRNLCLITLQKFEYCMTSFGIAPSQAHQLIEKVCRNLNLEHSFVARILGFAESTDEIATDKATPSYSGYSPASSLEATKFQKSPDCELTSSIEDTLSDILMVGTELLSSEPFSVTASSEKPSSASASSESSESSDSASSAAAQPSSSASSAAAQPSSSASSAAAESSSSASSAAAESSSFAVSAASSAAAESSSTSAAASSAESSSSLSSASSPASSAATSCLSISPIFSPQLTTINFSTRFASPPNASQSPSPTDKPPTHTVSAKRLSNTSKSSTLENSSPPSNRTPALKNILKPAKLAKKLKGGSSADETEKNGVSLPLMQEMTQGISTFKSAEKEAEIDESSLLSDNAETERKLENSSSFEASDCKRSLSFSGEEPSKGKAVSGVDLVGAQDSMSRAGASLSMLR